MYWLVAPPATAGLIVFKVSISIDLFPVRKELGVCQRTVDLVRVETYAIWAQCYKTFSFVIYEFS
jgi:hypothetical protein